MRAGGSFDLCLCDAALRRLVRAARRLVISRERAGAGRSPADPRERCGCRAAQNRRAAYGYGYGAGVAGGATASTYWGGQSTTWGDAYAAQNDARFGQPHYAMRAYAGGSPYYGYTGWEDYSGRNFIKCQAGTLTKLDDGRMYRCQ